MGAAALFAAMGGAPGLVNGALPDASAAAGAGITFQNGGNYLYGDLLGGHATTTWVTPANTTVAAFYQLQVNINSGTMSSGTFDSWLDLSTGRSYAKNDAPGTAVLRVRIRDKASGLVRTDQTVSIIVS